MKRKAGRQKRNTDFVGMHIKLPAILDDLIRSESIVRGLSLNAVINDIISAHYLNNTYEIKILKLIARSVMGRKSAKVFKTEFELLLDTPEVPKAEIEASKFSTKRRVKRNFPEQDKPPLDIFDLTTLPKKPL